MSLYQLIVAFAYSIASYLLIAGLAYSIAYWISSTGLAYWRAILGFTVALVAAWIGGVLIGAFLASQLGLHGLSQSVQSLLGKGFWWASIGAGFGVYRARFKRRTGEPAPAFKFPSWIFPIFGGVVVMGFLAAVGLPAYQDYAKRVKTSEKYEYDRTLLKPFYGKLDEEIEQVGTGEPWKQYAPIKPNPFEATQAIQDENPFGKPKNSFDQFDPSTAKPVETVTKPYPQAKTAEDQEHYRQIYAAYPDADEIAESPVFKAWVAKYPTYQRFLAQGTAEEIVGMFTAYKNQR